MTIREEDTLTTEAYQQALALLRRCQTTSGFIASPVAIDNYARVWARDGIITGLAALVSGDSLLIEGMERTLYTLKTHQGPHGEIPSNVSLDGQQVSYGRLVGRVDAPLWYIIGTSAYLSMTKQLWRRYLHQQEVERAMFLLECWEYNNRGLLYTPISGNWADEYILEGYILSDQLLYLLALQLGGEVFSKKAWLEKAHRLHKQLALNYWPDMAHLANPQVYHTHAYRQQAEQGEPQHWLAAFSPTGYTNYFDALAHGLALLTGLGNEQQREQAERYTQGLEQQTASAMLPAFWPVIQTGDAHWAALQANHLFGTMKNQPYHYHNGGLWSMVTGFYILGLMHYNMKERAQHVLNALNRANAQGREEQEGNQWEFAEYHHGQTHEPLGTPYLAWSAAATVLGHQAVMHNIMPFQLT